MSERFYQAFHTELASDTTASLAHTHGLNDAYTRLICDRDIHDDDALASYECAFLTRFTCNSAAIEGSTLSEIDTQLVLEGEFVPSDHKEVSDMFAVRGVAEGYGYAMSELSTGRVIDAGFIKDIHERTALDCQPRLRGTYRQSAAMIAGSPVSVSHPSQIPAQMDDLIFAYENSPLPDVARACIFHAMFENIHPFADGNGRTGRTVMNLMLTQAGYPPVALKNANRRAYLSTLMAAQIEGDFNPLITFAITELQAEITGRATIVLQTREHTRPQARSDDARQP